MLIFDMLDYDVPLIHRVLYIKSTRYLAFKELKGQHRTPLSLSLFRALFHSSQVHKTCGASSNSFISLTSARRFTHSALEEEKEAAERKLNNNNNNNNNNNTGDEQIN